MLCAKFQRPRTLVYLSKVPNWHRIRAGATLEGEDGKQLVLIVVPVFCLSPLQKASSHLITYNRQDCSGLYYYYSTNNSDANTALQVTFTICPA